MLTFFVCINSLLSSSCNQRSEHSQQSVRYLSYLNPYLAKISFLANSHSMQFSHMEPKDGKRSYPRGPSLLFLNQQLCLKQTASKFCHLKPAKTQACFCFLLASTHCVRWFPASVLLPFTFWSLVSWQIRRLL